MNIRNKYRADFGNHRQFIDNRLPWSLYFIIFKILYISNYSVQVNFGTVCATEAQPTTFASEECGNVMMFAKEYKKKIIKKLNRSRFLLVFRSL